MSWQNEWKAISDRIEGFLDATRFFSNLLEIDRHFYGNFLAGQLLPQASGIFETIKNYSFSNHSVLPSQARDCIARFINSWERAMAPFLSGAPEIYFRLSALAVFRSEFTYHLSDRSEIVRRLSERAFIHLQRSIVANPDVRASWRKAYHDGEVACEKLGGAHLLWHGIWAFKAHGEKERTDLILGEPLLDLAEAEGAAEALVLTEWKLVPDPSKGKDKAIEARKQASLYGVGTMGGFELSSYAYIILVSDDRLPQMPGNIQEANLTYRHINIAVNPSTPSQR